MLTSKERARLAGLAAKLDPVVMLGRGGASEGVRDTLAEALDHHELVKLRFADFKGEKKELALELAAATGADLVRVIGNVAVFWKRNPDPDKRKVALDAEPAGLKANAETPRRPRPPREKSPGTSKARGSSGTSRPTRRS